MTKQKNRKQLSSSLSQKILVKNRHCCCICREAGIDKEVLIHHIDGNNSNTVESNLAVLCLVHASKADAGLRKGKLGTGRKLTPYSVKKYKSNWEKKCTKPPVKPQIDKEEISQLRESLIEGVRSHVSTDRKARLESLKKELTGYLYLGKIAEYKLINIIYSLDLVANKFECFDILLELILHSMNKHNTPLIAHIMNEVEIRVAIYDDDFFYPVDNSESGYKINTIKKDKKEEIIKTFDVSLSLLWETALIVIEYHEDEKLMILIGSVLLNMTKRFFRYSAYSQLKGVVKLCEEIGISSIGLDYEIDGYKFKNFLKGISTCFKLLEEFNKKISGSKFSKEKQKELSQLTDKAYWNVQSELFYRIWKKKLKPKSK